MEATETREIMTLDEETNWAKSDIAEKRKMAYAVSTSQTEANGVIVGAHKHASTV